MFKVVPDQLRISDGWVRCGQCDEVFDANANLYADPEPQSEPFVQEAVVASGAGEDRKSPLSFANERHPSKLPAEDVAFKINEAVEVDTPDLPDETLSDEATQQEASTASMQEPVLDDLLDLRPGHAREAHGIPDEVSAKVVKPSQPAEPRFAQVRVKTVEHTDLPKLSFMRQSRGVSAWQSSGVRVLLSLVALLLLGAFALQVVAHDRDRIAATNPSARGALLVLCDWLGCKVQSVRQIESVVIDSSSFVKVRADVYRLNFTLKSTAAISLAVPALELTLTDLQDQAVVRRVLLASELGAGIEVLGAGAELTAVLPVAVKPGGANERISGYRLLAFYP
jgi:predicted Zn finger-like uncharacterized protein